MAEIKAQIIKTKHFGPIRVVQSWATGNAHICELEGGGYAHMTGLPVKSLEELRGVLSGEDWDRAVEYFENRGKEEELKPRKIMILSDGSFAFEDGTPITSYNEITSLIPPGALQEAALDWFAEQRQRQAAVQSTAAGAVGEAARQVTARKPGPKKAISKKRTSLKAKPGRAHSAAPAPSIPPAEAGGEALAISR